MVTLAVDLPVEMVVWPRDEWLRHHLARAGVPRLLLVESGAEPPEVVERLEDWIRTPADERDIAARAGRLARLAAQTDLERAVFDDRRVLSFRGRTAVLSRTEARFARALMAARGRTLSR